MADTVGTKTNKKTQAGRDVYETPEGEMVSEKSTTFKYKGQWINIPSIHEGNRYDDDTLILMLEAGLIEPTSVHKNRKEAEQAARKRSDSLKFNQGGTPMLEQQMELFEDGGLRDEGGEVDEVSGNEVPIGGTKKGVRDDVPAMVSEGEFVFPEDVTRYIGLDKLMQMRQEAKMGLKRMEAMGQMGNGDEATMPDDLPFDMADLIIVAGDTGEELEMQEGGFVTRPTTARRTEQQPTYAQPPAERPPEFRSTRALTPAIEQPQRSAISFKDLMNEAFLEFKEYRNEQGQSLLVAFIGDKPVYNIPAGYTLYDPEAVGEEPNETVEELNEVLKQTPPEPDKVDSGFTPDPRSEFQRSGSWDNSPLDMYIKEASKFTNGSTSLATGLMGAIGGPILGGAMYLGTKMQKKKILETIDARIEEARGTPIAGQVAALQQIKKQLEEGGGGLLDSVVNVVTNIFAPEEVKTKATNAANVDAGESANVTTNNVVAAVSPQIISGPKQSEIEGGYATIPTSDDPSGPETDPYAGDVVKTDVRTRDSRTGGGVPDTYTSAPKPEETVSQAQQNFLEGAYNVASADPNAAFENVIKRQRATDLEKARADIQTLRSGENLPEGYGGGVGSEGYNKALRDLSNIYGADTVREAESNLLPNRFAPVGGVPSISQARMQTKPEEATRDLSGIPTAMDTRGNIAARPTPQVEITQQPTPVTDAYVGSLDADTQLAPVQMGTDTGRPSYDPAPADPRVPRRFVGAYPFNMEDTSDTLAAFNLSPAPQESGTFTKDGISMLPSADESDITTEAYIAGDRAGVLSQTTPYGGVSPNTQGTAGNRAGVSTQQPPSLQDQALNLLSPEAQARVLNQDTNATIANAKKVISDSSNVPELAPPVSQTVETSLRPKARPSVTDQVKALGIDVDSPFATAMPQQPISGPKQSELDGGRATIQPISGPKQSELDGGRATISDASALQTGPAVRGRKPDTPDLATKRPRARPTTLEKPADKVPVVKKVEKPKGKYNPADSPLAGGFKGNKLSIKEQKAFDNSIDQGNDTLTNHYAMINRLRNKQDTFAEGGFNRAEGAAMGLSNYDMEQAEKFGGSMQTSIDKGTHVRQKNPLKEPRKVTKDKPAGSQKSDAKEDSGCVIATHGISTGGFSLMDKAKAEIWCERTYHSKWYGEAFRRGYRYAGTRAIEKGKAKEHYQEFKDFVAYGRGLKKDWKSAINYYKRTIQFFLTGLFVKEDT